VNPEDIHPVTKKGKSIGLSRIGHIDGNAKFHARLVSYEDADEQSEGSYTMFMPMLMRRSHTPRLDDVPISGVFFWIHTALNVDGGLRIEDRELEQVDRAFEKEIAPLEESAEV